MVWLARLCLVKCAVKIVWVTTTVAETSAAITVGCRDGWRYFECGSALWVGLLWSMDWWYRSKYYRLMAKQVAHGLPYLKPPEVFLCCHPICRPEGWLRLHASQANTSPPPDDLQAALQ